MKKILLILLFLPIFVTAQQYIDAVKLSYYNTFNAEFENSTESTDVKGFEANLLFPVVLNLKYTLISGLDISKHQLLLSPEFSQSTKLYSTLLKVGVQIKHSEKWSSTLVLLPKIASDYKNLSGDDFYLGAYGIAKLKKTDKLAYRFGLYTSSEAFGMYATPIFGVYYKSKNNKLEIDASLPIKADINHSLGKGSIGIDYFGIGRSYNISQDTSTPVYIEQSPLEFSSYYQYGMLDGSILLRAKIGYTSNTHEVYEQGDKLDLRLAAFNFGDDRTQLNPSILGSVFIRFEFKYRIHFSANQ